MKKVTAIVASCRKTGLAVIRSLAAEGVPTVGLCYGDDQFGSRSRYLTESLRCPDPNDDEPGFLAFLLALARRYAGAVIFPADDASLVALSKHRQELAAHYRVVAQDWAVVRQLIEKRLTYELARRVGIPSPRICVTRRRDEVREFTAEVGFPCLIKPSVGHEFFHRFHAKMLLVDSAEHLAAALNDLADYRSDLMLSEYIPGDDSCGFNYNSFHLDGAPVAEFTAQKLRLRPTGIGFPVAVVSRQVPEIVALGRRLITAFGYSGYSCMEFKRDARNGVYQLMELNGRHNHSAMLDLACGINFPYYSYLVAIGDALPVHRVAPPDGTYWLDELKDLRGAIAACRQGTWRAFARPYLRRHASAVLSAADPLPALLSLADGVAGILDTNRSGKRSRQREIADQHAASVVSAKS